MPDKATFATSVMAVVTPDGATAGIVGWSRAGEEIGLSMEPETAVGVIVDLLHGMYKAPGFVQAETRTTTGVLETIPVNQFMLAIGENDEPLISILIGRSRLNFRLGSVAALRNMGSAALEMATVIERGLSDPHKH